MAGVPEREDMIGRGAQKVQEELSKNGVQWDPRFPNTNQTKNCWQNYVDFHRCTNLRGEDYAPCKYFKKVYISMCPGTWIEKYDTQREEGTFPVKL